MRTTEGNAGSSGKLESFGLLHHVRLDEFLGFEFKALKNAWENDENV